MVNNSHFPSFSSSVKTGPHCLWFFSRVSSCIIACSGGDVLTRGRRLDPDAAVAFCMPLVSSSMHSSSFVAAIPGSLSPRHNPFTCRQAGAVGFGMVIVWWCRSGQFGDLSRVQSYCQLHRPKGVLDKYNVKDIGSRTVGVKELCCGAGTDLEWVSVGLITKKHAPVCVHPVS
jgi:hypothetical protein